MLAPTLEALLLPLSKKEFGTASSVPRKAAALRRSSGSLAQRASTAAGRWSGGRSSAPAAIFLIDWEITTQPDADVLFSGTGAALSNTLVRSGAVDNDGRLNNVYNSSFQTGALHLAPGTYWLLLQNCDPAAACS